MNDRVAAQSAVQSPSAAEEAVRRDRVSRDLNVGSSMVNDLWGMHRGGEVVILVVGATFGLGFSRPQAFDLR